MTMIAVMRPLSFAFDVVGAAIGVEEPLLALFWSSKTGDNEVMGARLTSWMEKLGR
jgi:hypothetical protein